jgi:hypothetical protein
METIVEQLMACLEALDEANQHVAAAHVNSAIESLIAAPQSRDSELELRS